MANIRRVDPTHEKNLHTIWLETLDGSVSVPLTVQGLQGRNPFQISRESIIQTSTQLAQGGTKYDDFEPPFRPIVQEDWSGGRASEILEEDKTRYFDSGSLNTEVSGKAFLQGLPTWPVGYKDMYVNMPGDFAWSRVRYDNTYTALWTGDGESTQWNFTASALNVYVYLKPVGNPGTLRVVLYQGTTLDYWDISASDIPFQQGVGGIVKLYTPQGVDSVANQELGFIDSSGASYSDTDYWMVGGNADVIGYKGTASGGVSQQSGMYSPYYLVMDAAASGDSLSAEYHPFEYKGQLYFYSLPVDGSNSFLYYAGDRGAADPNSGDKTFLNDASKSAVWTADEWIGSYVLITSGPGSEEKYPYRRITDNTTTTLTVHRDWEIAHTTETEYVILSDKVTRDIDLGGRVTDVVVANGKVYFLRGDSTAIYRYEEYNASGTWTQDTAAESVYGVRGVVDHDESGATYLWVIRNDDDNYRAHVLRYDVPFGWGGLHYKDIKIAGTELGWSNDASVSFQEAADVIRFDFDEIDTEDTIIIEQDLSQPIDFSQVSGGKIGVNVKQTGQNEDVNLWLHDTYKDKEAFVPANLWLARAAYKLLSSFQLVSKKTTPVAARVEDNAGTSWYDHPNLTLVDRAYQTIPNIDGTTAHLYLAGTDRFNILDVIVGTPNDVNNDLTVKYWDGDSWNALTITDNTDTGASFATSNTVTWTMPAGWQKGSDDGTNLPDDYYWVELSWSVTPTSTMSIQKIYLQNTERYSTTRQTTVMVNAADADDDTDITAVLYRVESADWLIFQSSAPFDELKWDMGSTVNAVAATMTVEYFNGEQFVAVSNFSDGTLDTPTSTKTLAKDGSMTWDLPGDMAQITINGSTGYTVRMKPSATLTSSVLVVEVASRNTAEYTYNDLGAMLANGTEGNGFKLSTTDYLYIGSTQRFDSYLLNVGSSVNGTAANVTTQFTSGGQWRNATTTAPATPWAADVSITFNTGTYLMEPEYINGVERYWIRVSVSQNIDSVEVVGALIGRFEAIKLTLAPTEVGRWEYLTANTPRFVANGVDYTDIKRVSFGIANDTTGATIVTRLRPAVYVVRDYGLHVGPFSEWQSINNIIMYGEDDINPWVWADGALYEIQKENGNYVVRVPLGEMEGLSSLLTGRFTTTNDVYLWGNVGNHIHRYYNRTFEHVGYTRDSGLPADKQGEPSFLYSMPGRVLTGVRSKVAGQSVVSSVASNTGTNVAPDGFSTVLANYGQTIHEIFTAPYGVNVLDAYVQNLPGIETDRLWITMDGMLCHTPMPKSTLDPTEDTGYEYIPFGYLIPGWVTAGFFDIVKLYTKIKAITRNLSTGQTITVWYQADTGSLRSGWTQATEQLVTSPFDETKFGSQYGSGRKFRIMLVFNTNDKTVSPILEAYVLDTILRLPTANRYSFQCVLGDVEQHQHGAPIDWGSFRDGQDIAEQLDAWSDTPIPLRMYSQHGLFDDKIVMVEPPGVRPIGPQVRGGRYLYQLTVTEVES